MRKEREPREAVTIEDLYINCPAKFMAMCVTGNSDLAYKDIKLADVERKYKEANTNRAEIMALVSGLNYCLHEENLGNNT